MNGLLVRFHSLKPASVPEPEIDTKDKNGAGGIAAHQRLLGDGPVPASAEVRLPSPQAQLYIDDLRIAVLPTQGLVSVGSPPGR